jgi:hypothetical protein
MSIVVVERSFAEALDFERIRAIDRGDCLRRQGVRSLYNLVARDGRHMVCIYDAPDAEAVRATQDPSLLPYDRVWSALALELPPAQRDPRYETVVVQRELNAPITREIAEGAARDPLGCNRRNRCSVLRSLLSLDGQRMLCQYSAPDAESVRNANQQSTAPFTRVWAATVYGEPT